MNIQLKMPGKFSERAGSVKLESNIFFSVAAHATLIAALLFLAGRGAVSRVPERFIRVTLVTHEGRAQAAPAGGRKALAGAVPATVRGAATSSTSKPVPPKIHHKAEVKAVSEPKRPITKAVPVSEPSIKKQPAVPKAPAAEVVAGSADGKKEPAPITEDENFLWQSGRFTVDISRYSAPRPSGGGADAAGSSPSGGGEENGGSVHEAAGTAQKGRYDAIGAIRAAIERAKKYPLFARRSGMEGTVTAEFSIDGRGRPENVKIKTSSGFELLDAAAKETIIRAAPFPFVEGRIEIPIAFRLRREE
jgi:protein TonB